MQAKMDFLRLATWDAAEMAYLTSHLLTAFPGDWEQGKWLQYSGWRKDGVFVGHGEQRQALHGVVNISGYRADEHHRFLLGWEPFYCTRLDVQVTIPKPLSGNLAEIYARIQKHCKASLIQSETNDTLYVGARTSDIFTRLYEKPLDQMYLRLEFEIKGKRARAAWRAINAGATVDEVFMHYLELSKLPKDVTDLFRLATDGATEHAMNMEIKKNDENTLKWLESIDGAMMKALANHNIGERVNIILAGWVAFAGNLDRISEED